MKAAGIPWTMLIIVGAVFVVIGFLLGVQGYAINIGGVRYGVDTPNRSVAIDAVKTDANDGATPTQTLTVPVVKVLSVDHTSGKDGQYFNFDLAKMRAATQTDGWSTTHMTIMNKGTGVIGKVKLWASANGGSVGDGHGRFVSGAAPNQWRTGDELLILGVD